MTKRRIYTALLIGAALFFLSMPMPVPAIAGSWPHHRPPIHHHGHHHGPPPSFHFGIFLGLPVVPPYYPHGHYLHIHDSRCPAVVEQRVPMYIYPAPTWYIRR
jgi:hypothetical protein